MKRNKLLIDRKVLDILQEIIQEEKLPCKIDAGDSHKEADGSTYVEVLYEYESKNATVTNEALCRATNLAYDPWD